MLIDTFDTDQRVFLIAEIGNNHEGKIAVAERLIREAAKSGVDAVKFQTFKTEHYVSPSDVERFARLKRFELSYDEFTRLALLARDEGVCFISTPFDLQSAAFVGETAPAIKISSGDNTFTPLLEAVAATAKPILLSCGLATIDELRASRSTIRRVWREHGIDQQLAVLHCVSSYPVPPEQANLGAIRHLQRTLNCTVGYSDHTLGIEAAVASVSVGARIVEKHFTLDKNYSEFRDHQLSADPAEIAELVRQVRQVETLLGDGVKCVQPSEAGAVVALRRSIAFARDLASGATLEREDLTWLRPGGGVAPGREAELIGCTLKKSVLAGEPVTAAMLEEQGVS